MTASAAATFDTPISDPKRIVIRGVNWLGDAVMTTPALQRLRERFPHARITILAREKIAEVLRHHPAIDEVSTFSAGESPWSIGKRLRKEQFDLALVLPNSPRAAVEMWLARVPQRVGYARPWRNWFLTQAVPARPEHMTMRKRSKAEINRATSIPAKPTGREFESASHQLYDHLHLVKAVGADAQPVAPFLVVTADEMKGAEARLQSAIAPFAGLSQSGSVLLGVNPGAQYGPAKRWPLDRFAAVIRELSRQVPGCVWLALGGPEDRASCEILAVTTEARVINFAGKTTLRELMTLLKSCRALLTNDSGPMHVAAALGTPVVVPFGSTSPELTGPGLPGDSRHCLLDSNAPCSPCFRRTCPIDLRCMTGIGVEAVAEATLKVIR